MVKEHKKRVNIVKIRTLEMVKEGSMLYAKRKITSPNDCVQLIRDYIDNVDREMFIVLALDTKNQPTAIQTVSIGTLNSSLVHPREVFKMAILSSAASVIVAHNHPSGDLSPSKDDSKVTERLKEAGAIIGINVLDHLIVSDNSYLSISTRCQARTCKS